MNIDAILQTYVIPIGLKILGAIVLWIVGRWLIKFGLGLLNRIFKRSSVDATLLSYIKGTLGVLLNIVLIVAILGYLGIETTSFAALLAAGGIAIGAAWGGLLAHFAAGVFLVLFSPFRVGDYVSAGGVEGTVAEIGLFVTTINTPDNIKTIVANNTIFSDTIKNFSANPYRRVELVAQLDHSVDPEDAINRLKQGLAQIANISESPTPDVEILEFSPMGPVLAVRPYCENQYYWQVYFDTNRLIRRTFGEAGYPAPQQHYAMLNRAQ
ncbi:mechanosensitive ion channel family protein [Lyngbya confervoides]|uniref:Mechanosensitive ion channel family protein n=1 Tax=Lyngbya confervoides BDU141951 TaxID=1574623 RepID=A0ABD4T6Z4_9CYAN|nr:mechanosensitive ion channel family protein [Lyngbya confervoides]MCM1984223.1 mechanosensitive ion channel family protein [Lyngbya confervoides BDU141951]